MHDHKLRPKLVELIPDGLFFGGGGELLKDQVVAVLAVFAFAFVATYVIAIATQKTIGLRVVCTVRLATP